MSQPPKLINDPIHGHFELPHQLTTVLDTPHVQRLRELKQLGSTYLVFPGASHNRFEHSLGVSHLSAHFTETLCSTRGTHANALFENADHLETCVTLVQIAGLVHDIGHGPFSHMFDNVFLPKVCQNRGVDKGDWASHENRSVTMFHHLVDEYNVDLEKDAVRGIADLICGRKKTGTALFPRFLYDVVANSETGIDTDKFDYLARDTYNLGLQSSYGFDHRRLMRFAKVISDSICFHRKEIFNVYHIFLTRFQLHRTVYNHRAALAIDAMITDVFLEADHVFGIFDTIFDPEQFLYTTDSLLNLIERSKQPALAKARAILHRLRTRKLYKLVEEVLLPAGTTHEITAQDIINAQASGKSITADEFHLANVTLNFGMRNQNPVDRVNFFKSWEDTTPVCIPSSRVSYVLPMHFEERIVRVFSKADDQESRARVSHAFRAYMKTQNLAGALASPVLVRRALDSDSDPEPIVLEANVDSRVAKRMRTNGLSAR